MYFNKIDGDRIYLSPVSVEDVETYCTWLNDPEVAKYINGLGTMYNPMMEKEWVENNLKKGDYNFAIIDKETNKLIGNCGIMNIHKIHRTATVGIFIGEDKYRNHGYGTEALKLLVAYGFNVLNLVNIDLGVYAVNARAIKCYTKVGFKEYGRRHNCRYLNNEYTDEILMEYLRDDFYKNN